MQEMASTTQNSSSQLQEGVSWWYRATSLPERSALLQKNKDSYDYYSSQTLPNSHKAKRRLQRWKEQTPFNEGDYFAQRLAMDCLTEDDLLTLLDEATENIQIDEVASPSWFTELLHAFTDQDTVNFPGSISAGSQDTQTSAFLTTLKPLLTKNLLRLRDGIRDITQHYSSLPFDLNTILSLLFTYVPTLLIPKLSKTIVLEMHVARVQGNLQGETPEERFQNFLQQLAQPERMLSLLEEYAVLARQLVETLNNWVDCELELLGRLCADWEHIQSTFSPNSDPGVLIEVQHGAGDTHRGGHSVTILTWSSGFRLVYKPRAMTLDVTFQELLTWLNAHGQQPAFRPLSIIDKGTYGWSEFVTASDCTSREEVERFYQRQGSYLALLYALAAADFHAENLLAVGEHPILVDLEALFQPRMRQSETMPQMNPADDAIIHSVLQIGLLPQRLWSSDEAVGIDISGLGGHAGQLTPSPVPTWKEVGTDEMRIKRERITLELGKHQPHLNGQEINILEYNDSIVEGFSTTYKLLMQFHSTLLTEIMPRFRHGEVRCVLRPTRTYGMLLMESFHPNLLRDALDRERFLDRLWVGIEQQPNVARLIPHERADLLAGDIPLFTVPTDSCDLLSSRSEIIADFFELSGLDRVCERIQQLDERDMARQVWIIQASFTSLTLGLKGASTAQLHLHPSQKRVTDERLLAAAQHVGNRLCQLALGSEEFVGWMGVNMIMEREWSLQPTYTDLYSGIPGIALFLAYLGALTKEEHYSSLARSGLASIRTQIEWQKQWLEYAGIGAFEGLGSFIYLLSHLGMLWNDSTLYQEAEEIVKLLPSLISKDEMFDVISGSAGCIAALLSLYAVAPTGTTLETAIQCGEHLLAHAKPQSTGVGWSTPISETPLTGFAHGNAGIALNLLRLFAASGQERFRETALAAMEYERSLFSVEKRNWPDLRKEFLASIAAEGSVETESHESTSYMVAWCHGAVGIGMGRLASLQYGENAALHAEIDAAFQTSLAHGFGINHCLCHGDMSALEFVRSATRLPTFSRYEEQVQKITDALLDSIESQGWVTGVPMGVETPGLMIGIAGTGYALLQAASEKIPSVLLLEPPSTTFVGAIIHYAL